MVQFSQSPSGGVYLGVSYFGSDIAASDYEPTYEDLTRIQRYESLIDAEVNAVDAECNLILAIERFVTANKAVDGLRQAHAVAA